MKNQFIYTASILLFSLLLFVGCQNDPFSSKDASGRIQVRIVVPHLTETLAKIESANVVDRVFITVTAADMDTVQQDLTINNGRAQGEIEVKKGDDRKFTLTGESQDIIIFEALKEQDISRDTEVITLTIPLADFAAEPDSGLAPLTVRFEGNAASEGPGIAGWSWDFGDGETSTEQNPTHTYEQYGIFTVRLEVQDSTGSRHAEIKQGYISAAQLPTATFAAFPVSGEVPMQVEFKDFSLPGTSEITDWTWYFGDGDSSSTEQDVTHTYQSSGLYSVKLKVKTNVGTDTKVVSDYITVKNQGDDPTVSFTADPDTVFIDRASGVSDPVRFTDESDGGNGEIIGRLWQFGDGESSTEIDPAHRYRAHGDYPVSLTITTETGSATHLSTSEMIHVKIPNITQGDTVLTTIGNGDDTAETYTIGERLDQMYLVYFSAEDSAQGYPSELIEVKMYLAGTQDFNLVVLDASSLAILGEKTVAATDPEGAWHTFNVQNLGITLESDFFVGLRYIGDKNIDDLWWPSIGFDTSSPSQERSYIFYPGTNAPSLIDYSRYGPGNLMFKVVVKGLNETIKPT